MVMKWRKRKLYSLLVGIHTGEATIEINVKVLQKAKNKIRLLHEPVTLVLGTDPKTFIFYS